jgi:hypothetical protein
VPRAADLPRRVRVRQAARGPRVDDVAAETRCALGAAAAPDLRGASVAVAVGSRGIASLRTVVAETVGWLRSTGADPFIVPSMGSHGGATAEGQVAVLEHLGITETTAGCPIRSTMDVVEVGEALGKPVLLDAHAAAADGVVVINRVKPHTDFAGPLGSGLLKMLTVGLGNHAGAAQRHRVMVHHGYERTIRETSAAMLGTGRVVLGVAVVENGHDEVALVRALAPDAMAPGEEELCARAREWMPRLPVDELDLLVVDQMGKEISGAGMDSNVIGRHSTYFEPAFTTPRITFVAVCDLTAASGGNAAGIGGADLMTRSMHDKIDWTATYTNSLTSGSTAGSRTPVVLDHAEDVVRIAVACLGLDDVEQARVARIRNTLALDELEVSEAVWAAVRDDPALERIPGATGLRFDDGGALLPL